MYPLPMRQLNGDVKEAGITVLNEVGVDPGVDHLYAIKTIGEVHDKGGKVRLFIGMNSSVLPARVRPPKLISSRGSISPVLSRQSSKGIGWFQASVGWVSSLTKSRRQYMRTY
jgi:hypothetical protein